jgi:nicotinic acid mononucleotide adenylyltransferase
MQDFIFELNSSPWMGSIFEVGIGVPFQAEFLSKPGASKTIIRTGSNYSKLVQPSEIKRSVSRDMAHAMSQNEMRDLLLISQLPSAPLFSLAITGAHKSDSEVGETHGWISLTYCENRYRLGDTNSGSSVLHFTVKKGVSRYEAGQTYSEIAAWFMQKILLNKWETWSEAIDHMPEGRNIGYWVDVITDKNITIEEHLKLVDASNPLVYDNGAFRRALDYIRAAKSIYRGSFNPINLNHEAIIKSQDSLLEIDISNARKGKVTLSDIAHRIRMIDTSGYPVMIDSGRPLFVNLYELLKQSGKSEVTFVVGMDTFNDIANEKYIPYKDFLLPFKKGGGVKFLVAARAGHSPVDNEHSRNLDYAIFRDDHPTTGSSTEVRQGNLSLVNKYVADYILENNLYGLKK